MTGPSSRSPSPMMRSIWRIAFQATSQGSTAAWRSIFAKGPARRPPSTTRWRCIGCLSAIEQAAQEGRRVAVDAPNRRAPSPLIH